MSYFIPEESVIQLYMDASTITGVEVTSSPMLQIVVSEVAAYINDDITIGAPVGKEIPDQLLNGAILPMLVSRLNSGVQVVTSVSEGGSSAAIQPTYSHDPSSYKAVLNRYKRLGVPRA